MTHDPIKIREVTTKDFDTSRLLEHAERQADERALDFCIVDCDSHHYEGDAFAQIIEYIEDPVLREETRYQGFGGGGISGARGSYQELMGRIPRRKERVKEITPPTPHRDVTITKKWMDALGVDICCLFPTPMLHLGMTPRADVEVGLSHAYNRWLVEKILSDEPRIKAMLYLPFSDPVASLRMVEEFGDKPGVIGFCVTSARYAGVWDNKYMRIYAALQERNLPLGFHAAFLWGEDRTMSMMNRFISVHSLGFPLSNMTHLTNWIFNGMPERFPNLKLIWIESGLAWIPFLMQRLDHEYMIRSSEAAQLRRMPSDYMREMFYTSQPIEMVGNAEMLEMTFNLINAPSQLLYSSDYPHWDMDLPSRIYDLPFLSEGSKRNILGGNARKLFGLPDIISDRKRLRLNADALA